MDRARSGGGFRDPKRMLTFGDLQMKIVMNLYLKYSLYQVVKGKEVVLLIPFHLALISKLAKEEEEIDRR